MDRSALTSYTSPTRRVNDRGGIAYELDVHEAVPPARADQRLPDVSADREVHVQPVPTRMPLRHPHVRQRVAAERASEPPEERSHVPSKLCRLVAAVPRVGQRPEPIQSLRREGS